MIQDGKYTLVYNNGEYRTLKIETADKGNLAGKVIVSLKIGSGNSWDDFLGCGFLSKDNKISFWRKFSTNNSPERLAKIQSAVDRIARNPKEAGMAFALQSGRCCRCGRELTVPASIHAGMGPDCAEKYGWDKQDQVAVHDHLATVRQAGSVYADNQPDLFVNDNDIPVADERPQVPAAPATNNLPSRIQQKSEKALSQNQVDDDHIARMVAFKKANDPQSFYDPFGIDEKLTDAAAVSFWMKRFKTNPLENF